MNRGQNHVLVASQAVPETPVSQLPGQDSNLEKQDQNLL